MLVLLILPIMILPVGLAITWPAGLIYFSLLTGAAPITFGKGGALGGDFGKLDLYAIRLLGLWVAALIVVLFNLQRLPRYLTQFKFHALFLLFSIVALSWAPSALYGTRMVAKLMTPYLFLLLLLVVVSTREQIERIEWLMLLAGALAILVEVVSWLAGYRSEGKPGLGIPGLGPAPSSAHLAILSMLAFSVFRHSGSTTHLVLTICFACAAAAGFTRITIAGMFVGFSVILFLSVSGIQRYALVFCSMAAFPAIIFLNDTLRYRMFKGGEIPSLNAVANDPSIALEHVHGSGRFDAWRNVLETFFLPNPFFGSGTGTTQHYYYTHPQYGLNAIHSEYIRVLAELGMFGFALLLVAFGAYAMKMWKTYRTSPHAITKKYSLAALGGILVYFVFMATDNAIDYVTSSGIYVFTLIALSEKSRELDEGAATEQVVGDEEGGNAIASYLGKRVDTPSTYGRYPIIRMECK
jgi:O-antigen ligase